jgi:hypothetical protein
VCRDRCLRMVLSLLTVLLSAAPLFPATAAPVAPSAPQVGAPAERTAISVPAQKPVGIAAAGSRMWVTDAGTGEVLEFNPANGKLVGKIKLDLKRPQGLAFDGQRLWVADQASRQIVAFNVAGGRRVKAIPIQSPNGKPPEALAALGWDGKALWTVLAGDGRSTVNQIDAMSGRIVRSVATDCESRGVAFNASLLFELCFNSDRNRVAVVERKAAPAQAAETRKDQRTVQVLAMSAPAGLAHDGSRLWVLDAARKQAITFVIGQAQQWQPLQSTLCRLTHFTEVSWNVCLVWAEDKGIWIASADIMRKPGGPWIRVLNESGPSEIFTPYHDNPPTHLVDMNAWACVAPLTPGEAGSGTLLTIATNYPAGQCSAGPNVVEEIRNREIAYLCKDFTSEFRRGQEVVYWSVFDPGNYDYIVQYGFRDDGTITFRMGATGFNNPIRPFEAHMHNALWRIHPDIGGGGVSNVFLDTHMESLPPVPPGPSLATDSSQPVLTEGSFDFDPKGFTMLRVEGTSQNQLHHRIGYVLEPMLEGSSLHEDTLPVWPNDTELFAQHDFFVTKFNSSELLTSIGDPTGTSVSYQDPDNYLFASPPNEPVTNADVVLWYRSSAHHMPHDEDRPDWPGHTSPKYGITLVHWMGFDFVPHNFFDFNPLGGPHTCGSCGNGVCDINEDCCTCPEDCGGNVSCC